MLTEFKYDKILGPTGVNPFVYLGIRDGKEFRLDAKGQEEGAAETTSSGNSPANKAQKITNYRCQKCGTTGSSNDSFKPKGAGTCKEPNGRGGYKTSTSHNWQKN